MLIKKSDIPSYGDESKEQEFGPAIRAKGSNRMFLSQKNNSLDDDIGVIVQNETLHIPTRGTWSSPHLIDHILRQIGPAECYITSWSVKEQAVRILIQLLDSGKITRLHCLFDERIRVQCPQAYQLAANNMTDIKLTKIHAKVVVLLNDDWGVSICTSANLTRNPRIERFVVSTHREVAEYDRAWIDAELKNGNPFD